MNDLESITQKESVFVHQQGGIDIYSRSVNASYTGSINFKPITPVIKPIGSNGSGMSPGSVGNVRKTVAYPLQERYDFSNHAGSSPHINYDILGAKKDFSAKALGPAHKIPLWDND